MHSATCLPMRPGPILKRLVCLMPLHLKLTHISWSRCYCYRWCFSWNARSLYTAKRFPVRCAVCEMLSGKPQSTAVYGSSKDWGNNDYHPCRPARAGADCAAVMYRRLLYTVPADQAAASADPPGGPAGLTIRPARKPGSLPEYESILSLPLGFFLRSMVGP